MIHILKIKKKTYAHIRRRYLQQKIHYQNTLIIPMTQEEEEKSKRKMDKKQNETLCYVES